MTERFRADQVLPVDPGFSLHSPGFVDVADGRVVAVGPAGRET